MKRGLFLVIIRVIGADIVDMQENQSSRRVYHVTSYGADPTGKTDSTDALIGALSDAFNQDLSDGFLMNGIVNLGGAEIDLEGGTYSISRPLRLPITGRGNFKVRMLSKFDGYSMKQLRYAAQLIMRSEKNYAVV